MDAESGLKTSLTNGQCVIEFARAREVAHAETIEPIKGHGSSLVFDQYLGREFPGKHFAQYITLDAPSKLAPGSLLLVSPRLKISYN